MAADLTGIINQGEFFSQHYLDEILERDLKETLQTGEGGVDSPRAVADRLRALGRDYFKALGAAGEHGGAEVSRPFHIQLAEALGYSYQSGALFMLGDGAIPVLHEGKQAGSPCVLVLSGRFVSEAESVLDVPFHRELPRSGNPGPSGRSNEDGLKPVPYGTTVGQVIQQIFAEEDPPRWVLLLSGKDIILGERARWGKGQYLRFDLGELLSRRDSTALGITAVLLARTSLTPESGAPIHDTLDEKSHKHAHGVSADLKHAARQAVELIGNGYVEWEREKGRQRLYTEQAARELTEECLIYLYRLLFLFYAEARAEEFRSLPMNSPEYALGYSLEMLRELEQVPLSTPEAQNGSFFDASLKKIFTLVNGGHSPQQGALRLESEPLENVRLDSAQLQGEHVQREYMERGFSLDGLKSPLFDPKSTPRLSRATLKNKLLQHVIRLLSLSPEGRKGRGKGSYGRGRISYAQLGINQLGSVYEGLLSYTGFFSKESLYEVHKAGESGTDKTQQAYFVPERDLARYSEDELTFAEPDGAGGTTLKKNHYPQGTFIFRLAGRDRESSASYYTPEVLTRCLVKYSLQELLKDKTADEILKLTVCEPAMGSGAFLVEAVSQLSDAYLERKQQETGQRIPPDQYALEKQKVNTFIAAHGCYGVDLNPMAARLARVSLWLGTMHEGQKTPWFGGRLAVGNSLVGARLEVYAAGDLLTDEPLAKALVPVIKKWGNSEHLESELEQRLKLAEKAAPDAVQAVRQLLDTERQALLYEDEGSEAGVELEEGTAAESGEAGAGSEGELLLGGAPNAGSARAQSVSAVPHGDTARQAAARKETLKELKKLLAAFKLPRHHRKAPSAVPAADVIAGKRPPGSVYHFLLWDEAMSPFEKDKAIQELAPQEVAALKKWQKGRTEKYDKSGIEHLGKLSDRVDQLYAQWVRERTRAMDLCRSEAPVWGQPTAPRPAGGYLPLAARDRALAVVQYGAQARPGTAPVPTAYERLKEAMDAWVALWGWPLLEAKKLPSRAQWWKLLAEVLGTGGELPQEVDEDQLSLLLDTPPGSQRPLSDAPPSQSIPAAAAGQTTRDIARAAARTLTPHHWELEFAEVFVGRHKGAKTSNVSHSSEAAPAMGGESGIARNAEHPHGAQSDGGFDLTVGNPPWIKLQWNEQGLLEDIDPRLALDGTSASDAAKKRKDVLAKAGDAGTAAYLREFEALEGQKAFLNAQANYPLLVGVQTNLYKAFICRGWGLAPFGVHAWIHQEGLFDDPKGGALRSTIYSRVHARFQFQNKKQLFSEILHTKRFGLIITGPARHTPSFFMLNNGFDPVTIDRSMSHDGAGAVPGIKTDDNQFETRGHRSRLVHITEKELALFAQLFDKAGTPALEARLPIVHSTEVLSVLEKLARHPRRLGDLGTDVFGTEMWHETNSQKDGTLRRETRFPTDASEWIVSGPHFYVGNPLYKNPRSPCRTHLDYDSLDLTEIPDDYLPRTNYVPACSPQEYLKRTPQFQGRPVTEFYRHVNRRMIPVTGERTAAVAIIPPKLGHTDLVYSMSFLQEATLTEFSGLAASMPVDFYVRSAGKGDLRWDLANTLPLPTKFGVQLRARALRLNCLTTHYADLWNRNWQPATGWSLEEPRLSPWPQAGARWSRQVGLRNAFERRWALIEIDALAALELGLTIDELCTIYRTEFPVLRQFESDTWYDANGRVAFTNNASLGIGLSRKDFETWHAHLLAAGQTPGAPHQNHPPDPSALHQALQAAARGGSFTTPDGTRIPALSADLQQEIATKRLVPFTQLIPPGTASAPDTATSPGGPAVPDGPASPGGPAPSPNDAAGARIVAPPPFDLRDRERDMRHAYEFFGRKLRVEVAT